MTDRFRGNHAATVRANVALAAIKGDETLAQLAARFDLSPTLPTSGGGDLAYALFSRQWRSVL
jgi:hypothetical protein